MAVTHKAVFAQGARTGNAVCTAAKTTYDDAANAVKLADAGANGSTLKALSAMPRATVTATKLQLYISPDDGTTMQMVSGALMAAHTVAATTATEITAFEDITADTPIRLASGDSLWVGIGVALAGGIVFSAQIEDL